MIDSRPFGGTCALRGCDPKKVLVGIAEAIDTNRRLDGRGIHANGVHVDWPALIRFKRSMIEAVTPSREAGLAKAGIEAFHGRARFEGPNTVTVGDVTLDGQHVVVAAGAKPIDLRIPGADHLTTSEEFLELDELPRRVLFAGGGYISLEFAHVAARAGAQVTILHRGARPLERFDPDLVDQLLGRTRAIGVDVRTETEVTAIEQSDTGLRVLAAAAGRERTFDADLVVHGTGRVADIDDLNLDAAGVKWSQRGVEVNEYLQSVSNSGVYAGGDAAASGGPPLTPVAGYDGRIIAANLLKGNHRTPDYTIVPSVVFTIPPLASVGLLEEAARQRGLRFSVHRSETSAWYSSRRIAETASGYKVLVDDDKDQIIGAHLLGPHAEDTINLFALAMRMRMTATELKQMLFAYPTHASDLAYML
jgi:glutathione reductase (NADPH)